MLYPYRYSLIFCKNKGTIDNIVFYNFEPIGKNLLKKVENG